MPLPDHLHEDTYEDMVLEVATLLMAADFVWDMGDADQAMSFARGIRGSLEEWPWKDGAHSGDCTKTCHTCSRCLFEKYIPMARRMLEHEYGVCDFFEGLEQAVPA